MKVGVIMQRSATISEAPISVSDPSHSIVFYC